jgi:hypothetical protein
MPPEPPADDHADLVAWLRHLVRTIDDRTEEGGDRVLARLLYTAWPARCGQDQ